MSLFLYFQNHNQSKFACSSLKIFPFILHMFCNTRHTELRVGGTSYLAFLFCLQSPENTCSQHSALQRQ